MGGGKILPRQPAGETIRIEGMLEWMRGVDTLHRAAETIRTEAMLEWMRGGDILQRAEETIRTEASLAGMRGGETLPRQPAGATTRSEEMPAWMRGGRTLQRAGETIRIGTSLEGMRGGAQSLPRWRSGTEDATVGTRISGVQAKVVKGGTGARGLTGGGNQRVGIRRERAGPRGVPARARWRDPFLGRAPAWHGRKMTGVTEALETTGQPVRGRAAGEGSSGGVVRVDGERAMLAAGGSLLQRLGDGVTTCARARPRGTEGSSGARRRTMATGEGRGGKRSGGG